MELASNPIRILHHVRGSVFEVGLNADRVIRLTSNIELRTRSSCFERLPPLRILNEGVHAGEERHDDPVDAVAVAAPQHIRPEKRSQVVSSDVQPVYTRPHLEFFLRGQRRVPSHLLHMPPNVRHAVMIQGARQPRDTPVKLQALVQDHFIVATGRPSEKTQLVIGIDAATSDPSSVEEIAARNLEPDEISARSGMQDLPDLLPQRLGDPLIGIHDQHPVGRGPVHPEILLWAVSWPGPDEYPVCESLGNLDSPITAARIHHDDFIHPSQGFKTGSNIPLFVLGNNDSRNRCALITHETLAVPPPCRTASSATDCGVMRTASPPPHVLPSRVDGDLEIP